MTTKITRLNDAIRRSAERRRTMRRLEDELASFRTPAERAELRLSSSGTRPASRNC